MHKILCQEILKFLIFDVVITDTKRIMLLKIASKTCVHLKMMSICLMSCSGLFVHELPPLVFKRFSTTLHYSVMIQIILAVINTFRILNINLLMNLKF